MTKQFWIAGAAVAAVLGSAGLAQAATSLTLDLTVSDPSAGLNPGGADGYGTVTITEETGGSLLFTITPDNGASFNVNNNSTHHAFAFDLTGAGVSITNVSTGFSVDKTSPASEPPFGSWQYAIDYTGKAKQGNAPASLSFLVSDTLHDLTTASLKLDHTFSTGGKTYNIYAASDIFSGKTGNVGATLVPTGVPEPASWAMMLVGFGGLGAALRSRRSRAVVA
jgi:hypothetical protein